MEICDGFFVFLSLVACVFALVAARLQFVEYLQIHPGAHGALDDRLVARKQQSPHLARHHRPLGQFVNQRLGQFRQRLNGL
ncbi:hypothetical protein [Paraburkholderia phymatum]|uniref:hypothetical protein n=1 Tax=Paraburkholderia phymatum TaxID=148447 RepID=UPI0012FE0967